MRSIIISILIALTPVFSFSQTPQQNVQTILASLNAGNAMVRAAWTSQTPVIQYIILRPRGPKVVFPFIDKVVGGVASSYFFTPADMAAHDWSIVSPKPTPPPPSGDGTHGIKPPGQ